MSPEDGFNSSEVFRKAEALFDECLTTGELPTEITPTKFTEMVINPKHIPVSFELLKMFGKSEKTTYETEREAKHVAPVKKDNIRKRYHDELDNLRKSGGVAIRDISPFTRKIQSEHSGRVQALAVAHASQWKDDGKFLYHMMTERVGPALGYKYKVGVVGGLPDYSNTGDFHLIVSWMANHVNELKPLFINTNSLQRATALIALNESAVTINHGTTKYLIDSWASIIGGVDLISSEAKKSKLDPTESRAPRSGATSITKRFEKFFVDLEYKDKNAVAEAFGIEPDEISDDGLLRIANRSQFLQMVMLGLFQENRPTELKPLQFISKQIGVDVKVVTKLLIESVTTPNTPRRNSGFKKEILPNLSNFNMRDAMTRLMQVASKAESPGLGTAYGLLNRYTEYRVLGQMAEADQLRQLMEMFNLLLTDTKTMQTLALHELMD